mmetsp:Transcript_9773/g.33723  ORF Transcript_9773/g.33723 Transcript_9773/m.33723 type:complete len:300 (-) Transcript_9773:1454-2353(-)
MWPSFRSTADLRSISRLKTVTCESFIFCSSLAISPRISSFLDTSPSSWWFITRALRPFAACIAWPFFAVMSNHRSSLSCRPMSLAGWRRGKSPYFFTMLAMVVCTFFLPESSLRFLGRPTLSELTSARHEQDTGKTRASTSGSLADRAGAGSPPSALAQGSITSHTWSPLGLEDSRRRVLRKAEMRIPQPQSVVPSTTWTSLPGHKKVKQVSDRRRASVRSSLRPCSSARCFKPLSILSTCTSSPCSSLQSDEDSSLRASASLLIAGTVTWCWYWWKLLSMVFSCSAVPSCLLSRLSSV